jgi:hypothetical protein
MENNLTQEYKGKNKLVKYLEIISHLGHLEDPGMSPNLHEILVVFEQLSAFGRDLTLNL